VRTWRGNIHLCCTLNAVTLSPCQQNHAITLVLDYIFWESLDVDSLDFVLPDVKWILGVSVLEQIVKLLIVYLKKGTVSCYFESQLRNLLIEFCNAARNDPLELGCEQGRSNRRVQIKLAYIRLFHISHLRHNRSKRCLTYFPLSSHVLNDLVKALPEHCVSLSRASLSISEDSTVKALNETGNAFLDELENLRLKWVPLKDHIIGTFNCMCHVLDPNLSSLINEN